MVKTQIVAWKDIIYKDEAYPYKISNFGQVMNRKGMLLQWSSRGSHNGKYPMVQLYLKGKRVSVDVHRLVALHFVPNESNTIMSKVFTACCLPYFNCINRNEVDHINRDHMNPAAYNLRWATHAENMDYLREAEKHKKFLALTVNILKEEE